MQILWSLVLARSISGVHTPPRTCSTSCGIRICRGPPPTPPPSCGRTSPPRSCCRSSWRPLAFGIDPPRRPGGLVTQFLLLPMILKNPCSHLPNLRYSSVRQFLKAILRRRAVNAGQVACLCDLPYGQKRPLIEIYQRLLKWIGLRVHVSIKDPAHKAGSDLSHSTCRCDIAPSPLTPPSPRTPLSRFRLANGSDRSRCLLPRRRLG